jgi:uncharacterized membrane protein
MSADVTVAEATDRKRTSRLVGAAALAFMGVLHFVAPTFFDRIIPKWVPGRPRTWTYVSGLWELSSAALLFLPRTKRLGACLAAATIVAVYPANIQMAIDNPPRTFLGVLSLLRLPLQFPMIAWAIGHTRD